MLTLVAISAGSSFIFFIIGAGLSECDRKALAYTIEDMSDEIKKLKMQLREEKQRIAILERENETTRNANCEWYHRVEDLTREWTDAHHMVDEVEQKLQATWVVICFSIFVVGTVVYLLLLSV